MDVTYFPFDDQTCNLKLSSWMYDGNQVSLRVPQLRPIRSSEDQLCSFCPAKLFGGFAYECWARITLERQLDLKMRPMGPTEATDDNMALVGTQGAVYHGPYHGPWTTTPAIVMQVR